MAFTRWVVARSWGTNSSRSSFTLLRPTGVETLIAGTVAHDRDAQMPSSTNRSARAYASRASRPFVVSATDVRDAMPEPVLSLFT